MLYEGKYKIIHKMIEKAHCTIKMNYIKLMAEKKKK